VAIGPNQSGQPGQAGPAGSGSGPGQSGAGTGRLTDGGDASALTGAAVTMGVAIATLGLSGAAAMHFSHLWSDLGANPIVPPKNGTLLPTQYGPTDNQTAPVPAGLSAAYQKALVPGEADAMIDGQITTVRGLVHPLHQVAHLQTPAELFALLGLGFAIHGRAGADSLAFDRDAESIEVLRFAGLRQDDLITPVEADVVLPADTVPLPLVRHHARPWTGTGEAPGSTSSDPIDEHEVLGYAAVALRTSPRSGACTATARPSTCRRTTLATRPGSAPRPPPTSLSAPGSTTAPSPRSPTATCSKWCLCRTSTRSWWPATRRPRASCPRRTARLASR
jgi:hypothetical protein